MADLVLKKLFQNFGRLYLIQMGEIDALEVTQSGPDTHDMTHTKREPHGQPRDPSLCRKTILETIKSFKISDYYKVVFLHIEINNSCLVKLDGVGPVDNRPSNNKLHKFVNFFFFLNLHVTCDMCHMTFDML